jgi:hypothetical protein
MSSTDYTQCRDYVCCNMMLADLHALLEHFETNHVQVVSQDGEFHVPMDACPGVGGIPASHEESWQVWERRPSVDQSVSPSVSSGAFAMFRVSAEDGWISSYWPPEHTSPTIGSSALGYCQGIAHTVFPGECVNPRSLLLSTEPISVPKAELFSKGSGRRTPRSRTTPSQKRKKGGLGAKTIPRRFACDVPGCVRTYKQKSGLKYHRSHGKCQFGR